VAPAGGLRGDHVDVRGEQEGGGRADAGQAGDEIGAAGCGLEDRGLDADLAHGGGEIVDGRPLVAGRVGRVESQ
jgi:hypothetical protein